jgi:hypothetical protein
MALQSFGPWPLFQFLNLYTVGRTPRTGDQPVAKPVSTHRTTQTQNKRTQTSMHRVGFEPKIPVFERASVIGPLDMRYCIKSMYLILKRKTVFPFLTIKYTYINFSSRLSRAAVEMGFQKLPSQYSMGRKKKLWFHKAHCSELSFQMTWQEIN